MAGPCLTIPQILAWADQHRQWGRNFYANSGNFR